jgi:zinc protease
LIVATVAKLPLVSVAVIVDAGAVCDSAGNEGVARLAAKLMLEGTEKYDGAELTERFERLGASIDAEADWDEAALTMTVMSDRLPAAFDLLGEVLRTPSFPQREVDRLKAERQAELLQLRAEPRGLADELFTRFLYTPSSRYAQPDGGDETSVARIERSRIRTFYESRYAQPDGGDETSVARIERSHIRSFYESRYVPAATTVIVVGDVTADRAEELAKSTLGGWSGSPPPRIVADASPSRPGRAVHIVAKTDAPQSELRIGHVGIPRNHPDYFAVNVMNAILGGLFNSRINLNLREAHGYTYGAFSVFDWRRQAGPFLVQTAVRSDITDAAAREVISEIDRIRADRVGEDELSLATSYLDGVFPIRFETTAAIAAALSVLVVHGLPEDYYDRYRERVRAVTREQILEAARRHLHPDALQLVAVGDPAVVRERLTSLDFGPVALYDAAGQRTK